MNEVLLTESAYLDELRRRYRAEGYVEIPAGEVAETLGGHRPDLVLRHDDEVVVIELKSPHAPLSDDQLHSLRKLVERQPGWRFRFMVVPHRPPMPPDEDDIGRAAERIGAARRLLGDDAELASAQLWMAVEAAMRELLTLRQDRPPFPGRPMEMARTLRRMAVLSDEDLAVLDRGYLARSLAVHGYRIAPGFEPPPELFSLADRLLRAAVQSRSARPGA